MKHALFASLIGLALATVGCGTDSAQPLQNKDAAMNKDAPPGTSDVMVLADTKDLPPSSPETMPDLPAPKDGPVAYDVTKLDVAAVDATDAAAVDGADAVRTDVADAPVALDATVDLGAVDQGSALDGARQGVDAQTVDLSALPAVMSFPCRDDDDCCTTVDSCMARVYLYSQGPGGSLPTIPLSTGMCLPCMIPAIQVTCVSGQCVGAKVSSYPSAMLKSHCGTLSLSDAGAHAPKKVDAGAPTTKSVWTCGD
jgi:hypothetical protein